MNDNEKLLILREAKTLYAAANQMNRVEREAATKRIAGYDFFSIGQLAQLSGYSTATLYNMRVPRGSKSGRFNPHSLDTLIFLLDNRVQGLPVNDFLLNAAVRDGNSHRVIQKMTGISAAQVTRTMKRINDNSTDLLGATSQ